MNDTHLHAAWEAYTANKNSEDLADSLAVLADVKRDTVKTNTDYQSTTAPGKEIKQREYLNNLKMNIR